MVEEGIPAEGTDDEVEPEDIEPPQPAVVAGIKQQRRDSAKAMQEEGSTDDEGSDDLQVRAYCILNLSLTNSAILSLKTQLSYGQYVHALLVPMMMACCGWVPAG